MTHAIVLLGIVALVTVAGGTVALEAAPELPSPLSDAMKALAEFHANPSADPPGPFDVTEIARRALGRHWRDRSEADVAEFGELIVRRMLGWYAGLLKREGTPTFGEGTAIDGWAMLSATAPQRGRKLVYRLRRTDGGPWRVYDVETNGRSRVRAYYTEFDRIILNEGYRVLVGRLQADPDGDTTGR